MREVTSGGNGASLAVADATLGLMIAVRDAAGIDAVCDRRDQARLLARFADGLVTSDAEGGPARGRNRALAEVRGRYSAAPDRDDLCLPDCFARRRRCG